MGNRDLGTVFLWLVVDCTPFRAIWGLVFVNLLRISGWWMLGFFDDAYCSLPPLTRLHSRRCSPGFDRPRVYPEWRSRQGRADEDPRPGRHGSDEGERRRPDEDAGFRGDLARWQTAGLHSGWPRWGGAACDGSGECPDPAKDQIVAPNGSTDCRNGAPVWAPDGKVLAYTSNCTGATEAKGQEQIFLWDKGTGTSRQLTHVKGLFQQVAWASGRQDAGLSVCRERDAFGGGAGGDEAVVRRDWGGWRGGAAGGDGGRGDRDAQLRDAGQPACVRVCVGPEWCGRWRMWRLLRQGRTTGGLRTC